MAIYAALRDLPAQCPLSGRIKKGLKYLSDFDPDFFKDKRSGFSLRVKIYGNKVYAIHQKYGTRPASSARFEAHRDYIDVQVVWSGEEIIPVAPVRGLRVTSPYDPDKDIQFYKFHPGTTLIMKPGMAAIFYPSDGHAPCISFRKRTVVSKTVVKIRV